MFKNLKLILYNHINFYLDILDVIGVVEEFEKAKQISTRFGERDIVRFKLTNGRLAYPLLTSYHIILLR